MGLSAKCEVVARKLLMILVSACDEGVTSKLLSDPFERKECTLYCKITSAAVQKKEEVGSRFVVCSSFSRSKTTTV